MKGVRRGAEGLVAHSGRGWDIRNVKKNRVTVGDGGGGQKLTVCIVKRRGGCNSDGVGTVRRSYSQRGGRWGEKNCVASVEVPKGPVIDPFEGARCRQNGKAGLRKCKMRITKRGNLLTGVVSQAGMRTSLAGAD